MTQDKDERMKDTMKYMGLTHYRKEPGEPVIKHHSLIRKIVKIVYCVLLLLLVIAAAFGVLSSLEALPPGECLFP